MQPDSTRVVAEIYPAFSSKYIEGHRPVHVLLPPDYAPADAPYPLLVLNDGQDLAALRVAPTIERLVADGAITPPLVVAVHTTANRLHEYGTIGIPNAQGYGAQADAYAALITQELLPWIAQRYHVSVNPAQRAIAGASLGGLSAFDLAWNAPMHFGVAGAFSGSFWWRTDDRGWRARQRSRIAHARVRATPQPPAIRCWFQAGTEDEKSDRDRNGVIDAIQDTTELIDTLVDIGFRRGDDVTYVEVAGGRHDQATWAKVMPEFLRWTFGMARRPERGPPAAKSSVTAPSVEQPHV